MGWSLEWKSARLILPFFQMMSNCLCASLHFKQFGLKLYHFALFGIMVLFRKPYALEVSVTARVLGRGCPNPSRATHRGIAALKLYYKDATSVSDAEPMACLMMLERVNIASLLMSLLSFLFG